MDFFVSILCDASETTKNYTFYVSSICTQYKNKLFFFISFTFIFSIQYCMLYLIIAISIPIFYLWWHDFTLLWRSVYSVLKESGSEEGILYCKVNNLKHGTYPKKKVCTSTIFAHNLWSSRKKARIYNTRI